MLSYCEHKQTTQSSEKFLEKKICKKTRQPTSAEINELIAFLPKLYAEGFEPINQWLGGLQDGTHEMTMPFPEYNQIVTDFFHTAGKDCWCDDGYDPDQAGKMIRDADIIKNSSLDHVKTMLTYCVRGNASATDIGVR